MMTNVKTDKTNYLCCFLDYTDAESDLLVTNFYYQNLESKGLSGIIFLYETQVLIVMQGSAGNIAEKFRELTSTLKPYVSILTYGSLSKDAIIFNSWYLFTDKTDTDKAMATSFIERKYGLDGESEKPEPGSHYMTQLVRSFVECR